MLDIVSFALAGLFAFDRSLFWGMATITKPAHKHNCGYAKGRMAITRQVAIRCARTKGTRTREQYVNQIAFPARDSKRALKVS
eukprot:2441768-Amphidinium_carterae.2